MSETYPQGGIAATRVRQRIRGIIAERDMTVLDLARLVGWSRSSASRRMRRDNPQPLSITEIESVATALDVPLSAIITDADRVAA